MKRILFLLVFMGLAVAVFYSCKKDGANGAQPQNEKTYTAEEIQIWRNLTAFNQKIKTGVRDEEFISPDSAMWYLEALINATEAVDTTFDDYLTYGKTYELSVNDNGTVNMTDVILVYNQMVTDLNTELNLLTEEYKFFIVGDVESEPTRDGSTITLGFTGGIGINPLAFYEPITTSDNWRSGNMNGKCVNPQWDSDAGQELKRRFNNPDFPWTTPPGNTWIDVEVTGDLTYLNFGDRIFHEIATSDPCIDYTQLQYYLVQGHYLFHNYSTDVPSGVRPLGKSFITMELWTNPEPAPNDLYIHHYQATYGVHVDIPPIE